MTCQKFSNKFLIANLLILLIGLSHQYQEIDEYKQSIETETTKENGDESSTDYDVTNESPTITETRIESTLDQNENKNSTSESTTEESSNKESTISIEQLFTEDTVSDVSSTKNTLTEESSIEDSVTEKSVTEDDAINQLSTKQDVEKISTENFDDNESFTVESTAKESKNENFLTNESYTEESTTEDPSGNESSTEKSVTQEFTTEDSITNESSSSISYDSSTKFSSNEDMSTNQSSFEEKTTDDYIKNELSSQELSTQDSISNDPLTEVSSAYQLTTEKKNIDQSITEVSVNNESSKNENNPELTNENKSIQKTVTQSFEFYESTEKPKTSESLTQRLTEGPINYQNRFREFNQNMQPQALIERQQETTTIRTTRQHVWVKPAPFGYDNSNLEDQQTKLTADCPGLTCEYGYKTDLYGKVLCSCFNPCVENKCGSKICKVEKVGENKFLGLCYNPKNIERPVKCHMPVASGSCKNYVSRYYYNSFKQQCLHFIFGGCQGNQNNFPSWEKCHMECNSCAQPPVRGPCHGNLIRYYFDSASQSCVAFNYGGCKGNENNFRTKKQCEDSCISRKEGSLFLHGLPYNQILKYYKDGTFKTKNV